MARTLSILGSTGSIGTQTLDVLRSLNGEFTLRWITCNTRVEDLVDQVRVHAPHGVAIRDEGAWARFKELCPEFGGPVLCGEEGLCEAAADTTNDIVMSAMVGFSGVVPTLAAISSGHTVALANKETLVSAGDLIMSRAREQQAPLVAVDSEHSAIAQCLVGEPVESVTRLILTASGGPFLTTSMEELERVTPQQALRHPNWTMGAKITVDSATLMNKGFEVIEAAWLFDLPASAIHVVIHPQSIIHSMVEFVDGSVKAQMGYPTMSIPIQYALTHPQRLPLSAKPLSLADVGALTFEEPDVHRFPCLQLAYDALAQGGTAGCVVNAANEVAVHAFLGGRLRFTQIPVVIEQALSRMNLVAHPSLDDILQTDSEVRIAATEFVETIAP